MVANESGVYQVMAKCVCVSGEDYLLMQTDKGIIC